QSLIERFRIVRRAELLQQKQSEVGEHLRRTRVACFQHLDCRSRSRDRGIEVLRSSRGLEARVERRGKITEAVGKARSRTATSVARERQQANRLIEAVVRRGPPKALRPGQSRIVRVESMFLGSRLGLRY